MLSLISTNLQFASNHCTSSCDFSCVLGSVFESQMHGFPHVTCTGSLYSFFTVITCWHPIHSFHDGKYSIPPLMSSSTAYPASGISRRATSPVIMPMKYTCCPRDLAHVVFPTLEGPYMTRDILLPIHVSSEMGKSTRGGRGFSPEPSPPLETRQCLT